MNIGVLAEAQERWANEREVDDQESVETIFDSWVVSTDAPNKVRRVRKMLSFIAEVSRTRTYLKTDLQALIDCLPRTLDASAEPLKNLLQSAVLASLSYVKLQYRPAYLTPVTVCK